MTGKDLLQAMNELEDEMIEKSLLNDSQTELIQMKQNRKSKVIKMVLKWSVAAIAALCCFGGGVAYAAKHGIHLTSLNWKHKYKTTIPKTTLITEDQLSKEIQAVKEKMHDITYIDTYHNTTDTQLRWLQEFDTVKETVDFIGYNNLKLPDFPGTLEQTFVSVDGNKKGDITSISALAQYSYENVSAHTQASLCIDADSDSSKTLTKYTSMSVNDTYTTKSGKKVCIILPFKYDFFDEFDGILGYLVDENVTYTIQVYNVNTSEQDIDYLTQLIKDWFDQF